MMSATLDQLRDTRPRTPEHLWQWVRAYTGVRLARARVCRDHTPPFDWFAAHWFSRPSQSLWIGSRGSGKSFDSALLTHLESRFTPRLKTRILGGSKAQSAQIFEAITGAVLDGHGNGGSDADTLAALLKESATYRNGSDVSILAASSKSVRGPHVPSLRLDEVDEIAPDLRESAMGMCMDKRGSDGQVIASASATMTSTWHRVGGPMTDLIERGKSGAFPVFTSCAFEVLERCPESRSGPYTGGEAAYERCPDCPLRPWCHAERDRNGGIPLAKLSDGHYGIGSLIQKVQSVSARAFEADYLCKGPKADGIWFTAFDRVAGLTERAEYRPALPVHLAVDSGVFTGAVAFQLAPASDGRPLVHVFWDYLSEGKTARENARAIKAGLAGRHGTRLKVTTDPAGGSRTAIGPTVLGEYHAEGLKAEPWPPGPVADSLALVEALLSPAAGSPRLLFHPRCVATATALANYRRAKRAGQFMDYPEDPQHPHEDMIDALRGGLKAEFPQGLVLPKPFRRAAATHIFS
jgi:hypothetical protein